MTMTIDSTFVAILMLAVTLVVHLAGTIWWAATVTQRIAAIEKWIAAHSRTAERLVALEQRIVSLTEAIARIENYLRQRP